MTMHGIDLNSEAIGDFCRKWKIKELAVFGSILRRDFRANSDLDFVADFHPDAEWDLSDAADMREELSSILKRNVDLMSRFALDSSPNWLLRRRILSSMETVYASR